MDTDGATEPGQPLRIGSVEGLESPILDETWAISESAVEAGKTLDHNGGCSTEVAFPPFLQLPLVRILLAFTKFNSQISDLSATLH